MRERLSRRLHRPRFRPAPLITLALFAVAGLMVTASAFTARGVDLRRDQVSSIADLVRGRTFDVTVQQEKVRKQQVQVEALSREKDIPGLERALAAFSALAPRHGFGAVSGRAVIVELADAPASMQRNPDVSPDDLVVHQQDLQAVINAMWRGRAKAVTVMGQRIIATTAIKCVGNTLLVQGRVYSPPYRIAAVGDPAAISKAILADGDVQIYRDYADVVGLGWRMQTVKKYKAPAYGALPIPLHAKAAG